eukprot:CAMPEP_0194222244 /NCGR_PEP_ID=MMETSP0156-20130528/32449_1 /TAXON_ID=33649 /ORGANISM="Thalassionema nitzschioides, Strain L26-B" /LENGTH=741 /DNA_ID=CAMNT_0038952951 /DNA_START=139 /DNA_END=2364 /DNA_ORIENTATION=-
MTASPLSTTPHASGALHELHEYLSHALETSTNSDSQAPEQQGRERNPEIFRSERCGVALYYIIVKDTALIRQSFSVLIDGSRGKYSISRVNGVIIAVGVSGLCWTQPCSSLITSITTRLQDFVVIMNRIRQNTSEECKASYKAMLSTMLLTEDEQRRTNAMVDAMQVKVELDHRQNEKEQTKFGIKSKRNFGLKHGIAADLMSEILESTSSADIANGLEKRSEVLSVAEKECQLRQYNKSNATEAPMRSRRRKPKTDDIFRDFDYLAPTTRAKKEVTPSEILSPGASSTVRKKSTLSRPQRDTASKKSNRSPSTLSSLPPPPSTLVSNRRNLSQSLSERRAQNQTKESRQAAFDAFDINSDNDVKLNGAMIEFPGLDDVKRNGKKGGKAKSIASPTASTFDSALPEASFPFSEGVTKKPEGAGFDPFSIENLSLNGLSTSQSQSFEERRFLPKNGTDESEVSSDKNIPRTPNGISSAADCNNRIQVHVALNEDLTCSYRQGRISSCAIEGVVQVQVKSDADSNLFFLLLRDPSRHIRMIQENRRYADDMTEHLSESERTGREDSVDHKFTISVPRAESYFPVMRYKCNPELRPVPIRVQTRVRIAQGFCRVALQISSNPANEDDLTDLTIIMGVPLEVRGESVTTHPPGGVWNAAKRSVIWCVAELGEGEKFQLQAQFELDLDVMTAEKDKPKFPVLVRCQCMYAQLSDIELEVAEIPDVCPAEVTLKLARRFRLMHRERS